jgi:hypothetical protein
MTIIRSATAMLAEFHQSLLDSHSPSKTDLPDGEDAFSPTCVYDHSSSIGDGCVCETDCNCHSDTEDESEEE